MNHDNLSLRRKNRLVRDLSNWNFRLLGEWSLGEIERIHAVLQELLVNTGGKSLQAIFNQQPSVLHRTKRPGHAGRTRGKAIFLDQDWTDWTFAHELGHRWNNAWHKTPESTLQRSLDTGRMEWLKRKLRNLEKWLRSSLQKIGIQSKIDWPALWYHPGKAPPPCGVDRNFNSSEDLAESFAASIFPEEAKQRARRAAVRFGKNRVDWDWGRTFQHFWQTPRGKLMRTLFNTFSSEKI